MVELKAVIQLEDVHLAQAINYLEAYHLDIGLLINIGNTSLQFKRVMKPKKSKYHQIIRKIHSSDNGAENSPPIRSNRSNLHPA